MKVRPSRPLLLLLLLLWLAIPLPASTSSPSTLIALLEIDGPIGPATEDYFTRALRDAEQIGATLVVLRIDTPGGLDSAMRNIIKAILASPTPIASHVAPTGARAASAGTYILYASHIAAMAPATSLGAATPVQMGGSPSPIRAPNRPTTNDGDDSAGEKENATTGPVHHDDAMTRKVVNDAVAYIRGLAELRERNADWAEEAVRDGASLTASEALQANVIDLLADDLDDLLRQLDGHTLTIDGKQITLATLGAEHIAIAPDWRNRLLAALTNPSLIYILLMIGIYGLIYEFANPGAILPGVAGAICLVLALYAMQTLPVNYAGLALMGLGVALMIAEAFAPSFGLLGIGGAASFLVGSLILIDTGVPGYGIALPVIAVFALTTLAIVLLVIRLALRSRQQAKVSGAEELPGMLGVASDDFDPSGHGHIWVHGESWLAQSRQPVHKGARLRVKGIDGLTLRVEPVDVAVDKE